jgi:hypothetical protein
MYVTWTEIPSSPIQSILLSRFSLYCSFISVSSALGIVCVQKLEIMLVWYCIGGAFRMQCDYLSSVFKSLLDYLELHIFHVAVILHTYQFVYMILYWRDSLFLGKGMNGLSFSGSMGRYLRPYVIRLYFCEAFCIRL